MAARFHPTVGVLVFYSVLVTAAFLLVLTRPSGRVGFDATDAREEAHRLTALARRTRLWVADYDGPLHVTWSPDGDGYRGLVVLPQWAESLADAKPEGHLEVRLVLEEGLFRNPARRPLTSATLFRRAASTDLVGPRDGRRMALAVDSELAPEARSTVSVDSVRRPAGHAFASAVGLPWRALAVPETTIPPTARDRWTLAVLTRLLRPRICDRPAEGSSCHGTVLTLTRSPRTSVYWITLTALGGFVPGAVSFELDVDRVGLELVHGTLRTRPGADLARPADLFVLPPRSQLEVAGRDDPGLVVAGYRPDDPEWRSRQWTIDFRTLLEGTDW